ncbi:MAG: LacI family DNA-binding transcriptional regulator [Clostridiales bacterium]|nr:LacI family DNA-binding transcriptional regulator [Clostridiales bacterium]
MVTIKDVAKAAGVAVSTASYALNGSSKVSEKTRKKVMEIAEDMKYVPNTFAQNLKKTKTTKLIALIVYDLNSPYYDKVTKGIQDVAFLFGYSVIIFCEYNFGRDGSYNFLKEGIVDGAIIVGSSLTDDDIANLSNEGLPLVLLDRKIEQSDICSVLINNKKGASEAVEYLIGLGHKKIGFISGKENSYDNVGRTRGYIETLTKNGFKINKDYILQGGFTEKSGYDVMRNFLSSSDDIPTAFFSANDEMLIGAMRAVHEKGLKVPEDIAFVGFDDIQAATYVRPKLTTIKSPIYEIGSFSGHMLFNLIKGRVNGSSITLDTELVVRESSGGKKADNKKYNIS